MCAYPTHYPPDGPPLTTDELRTIVDDAAALGTLVISLGGGEPFLRADAEAIIGHIDGHGITSLVHSNGSLLTSARLSRLAAHRRLALVLSLDSHRRAAHDGLRGLACFDRVVAAARHLAHHAPHVRLGFTFTVTAHNFRDMLGVMRPTCDLGVRTVRYTPVHDNLPGTPHRCGVLGASGAHRPAPARQPRRSCRSAPGSCARRLAGLLGERPAASVRRGENGYFFVGLVEGCAAGLRRHLLAAGIDAGIGSEVADYCGDLGCGGECPVAREASAQAIQLPLHEGLTDAALHRIRDVCAGRLRPLNTAQGVPPAETDGAASAPGFARPLLRGTLRRAGGASAVAEGDQQTEDDRQRGGQEYSLDMQQPAYFRRGP